MSQSCTETMWNNGGPRQAADTMPLAAATSRKVYPVCASGIIDVLATTLRRAPALGRRSLSYHREHLRLLTIDCFLRTKSILRFKDY